MKPIKTKMDSKFNNMDYHAKSYYELFLGTNLLLVSCFQ